MHEHKGTDAMPTTKDTDHLFSICRQHSRHSTRAQAKEKSPRTEVSHERGTFFARPRTTRQAAAGSTRRGNMPCISISPTREFSNAPQDTPSSLPPKKCLPLVEAPLLLVDALSGLLSLPSTSESSSLSSAKNVPEKLRRSPALPRPMARWIPRPAKWLLPPLAAAVPPLLAIRGEWIGRCEVRFPPTSTERRRHVHIDYGNVWLVKFSGGGGAARWSCVAHFVLGGDTGVCFNGRVSLRT